MTKARRGGPRWVTRLHAWVYRRSGGRVLGRMGGQPVLLLQTTGRRSGQTHTTPVQYLADGDTVVVVAANAGARHPPSWYLNLRADPHAHIDVVGCSVDVRAQEATGPERAELWQRLTAANRSLERAARKARRDLPLITLVAETPKTPRPAADRS
jgi:deazaflavin-dependent oxidoreductase (nitroreductase family)